MAKHKTRKDWRLHPLDWKVLGFMPGWHTNGKKDLKKRTAKLNRLRPITDETPYKRLEDPYHYD